MSGISGPELRNVFDAISRLKGKRASATSHMYVFAAASKSDYEVLSAFIDKIVTAKKEPR